MSSLSSLLVALLTAVAAAIGSGFVAALSVSWYRISSREGASGFFVAGMGFLGFLGGAVIGIVVSRLVAGGASPGFLKALGSSLAATSVLLLAIAAVARAAADVPPEIDGERLWLEVEVRFPAGWEVSPEERAGEALLRLGAVGRLSRTVRVERDGILFVDDARLEEGRRVVPGIVELFTGRGQRVLSVVVVGKTVAGFVVPLPGRPGPAQREWSEWLPRPRSDGEAPATPFAYRFRVRKVSEPVRRETVGPFEVETACTRLFATTYRRRTPLSARSRIRIVHRGEPVAIDGASEDQRSGGERMAEMEAVLAVAAPRPALLVRALNGAYAAGTYLLVEEEGKVGARYVGGRDGDVEVHVVTSDPARLAAWRSRPEMRGWLDRQGLDREGLYLVDGSAVVDTRSLTVHRIQPVEIASLPYEAPPIALSPDERSFVRFGTLDGDEEKPVLVVTEIVTGGSYSVPVDVDRTGRPDASALGPEWVNSAFEWRKEADGALRLAPR